MSSRETIAFSEDAAYLAVALKDGQVKVWDAIKRRLTQTFSPVLAGKSSIACLAWSKESVEGQQRQLLLALGTGSTVVVWSITKGEKEALLEDAQGGKVKSVCWNQPNATLYSTSSDHSVVEWSADTWQQKTKWKVDKHEVTCLCCHADGKVLATAGRKIKLWSTEDHTLLQTFTGHATLVRHLGFVTESVVVSCAENDRVVDVWRQGQSTQALLSFVCEEAVTSLSVHQADDMIHLAAISEGGKLHLFSSPFESEAVKPISALCTVQFVSNASESTTPSCLPVMAAKLVSSQVSVAYTSLVRPTFESIDFNQSEQEVCLVRDVKKGLLIHQDSAIVTNNRHQKERVQVLAPGLGTSTVSMATQGGKEEVPLMDQLQQEAPPSGGKGVGRKRHKANAESLSKMLAQAVHTEDRELMVSVLKMSNNKIVNGTVRKLPSNLVVPLLKQLVNFLYTKPDRGLELSVWLRAILMCHTAYLTTIPQVMDSLNGLYQLLDTRVSTFSKLCHLQGKLDLMVSQSAPDHGNQEAAQFNTPMVSITAGDDFISSSPELSDKDEGGESAGEGEEEEEEVEDWSSAASSEEEVIEVAGDQDEKYCLLEESMDTGRPQGGEEDEVEDLT